MPARDSEYVGFSAEQLPTFESGFAVLVCDYVATAVDNALTGLLA